MLTKKLMGAGGAGGNNISEFEYITAVTRDGTAVDSHTFTNVNIGSADTDRKLLIVVTLFHVGDVAEHPDSVVVGTTNATSLYEDTTSVSSYRTSYWIVDYPTGTTEDITVNIPGFYETFCIAVYRIISSEAVSLADSAETFINPDTGVTQTLSGGEATVGSSYVSNASTSTWANLTENYDADSRSGEYFSTASTFSGDASIDWSNDSGSVIALVVSVAIE